MKFSDDLLLPILWVFVCTMPVSRRFVLFTGFHRSSSIMQSFP